MNSKSKRSPCDCPSTCPCMKRFCRPKLSLKKKIRKSTKSTRKPRKKSRSHKKRSYYTTKKCKSLLKDKIKINMREYKQGRWLNPKQAIAVSFSQIKKKYPKCKF